MPFSSLGQFVTALQQIGELAEIKTLVTPRARDCGNQPDRVVKSGGPALLFTKVEGSPYPVLTNQFGSERRMALALGAESLAEVEARIRSLADFSFPLRCKNVSRSWQRSDHWPLHSPRRVDDAPIHQIVEEPDPNAIARTHNLARRPGGPFITLFRSCSRAIRRQGASKSACTACKSMTPVRPACIGNATNQGRCSRRAVRERAIPVAVVIGADPALTYAATAPLPPMLDEVLFWPVSFAGAGFA